MSSALILECKTNLEVGLEKQMPTDGRNPKEIPSRYYKQQYRKAWEELPEFNGLFVKGCLKGVPENPSRAFCKVCNRNLHAHRLTLLKHTASIRHMKLAQEQFKAKQLEKVKALEKSNNRNVVNVEVEVNPDEVEINSIIENSTPVTVSCNEVTGVESGEISCLSVPEHHTIPSINNTKKDTAPQPEAVSRSPITTHVLDTAKGLPVPGLPVSIYQLVEGRWTYINEAHTNPDGRCTNLLTKEDVKPGRFKLHFDTDKYFELRNSDRLFPFIEIVFDVRSPIDHLHIPLLMSPYGYTTYRGS